MSTDAKEIATWIYKTLGRNTNEDSREMIINNIKSQITEHAQNEVASLRASLLDVAQKSVIKVTDLENEIGARDRDIEELNRIIGDLTDLNNDKKQRIEQLEAEKQTEPEAVAVQIVDEITDRIELGITKKSLLTEKIIKILRNG